MIKYYNYVLKQELQCCWKLPNDDSDWPSQVSVRLSLSLALSLSLGEILAVLSPRGNSGPREGFLDISREKRREDGEQLNAVDGSS